MCLVAKWMLTSSCFTAMWNVAVWKFLSIFTVRCLPLGATCRTSMATKSFCRYKCLGLNVFCVEKHWEHWPWSFKIMNSCTRLYSYVKQNLWVCDLRGAVTRLLSAFVWNRKTSIVLLGFWTLSIVRILIVTRKKNKHDVSETGSQSLDWG
jgi:hypothetical protein